MNNFYRGYHYLMGKKSLISLCLGAITCLYLIWFVAVPRLVGLKIGQLCENCLNGKFEYEDAYWEGGRLIFKAPIIATNDSEYKKPHRLACEQIAISYELLASKRQIPLQIQIDSPQFMVGEDIESLIANLSNLKSDPGIIEITRFDLNHGIVLYPSQRKWLFNGLIDHENSLASVTIYERENSDDNLLQVDYSKKADSKEIHMNFLNFNVAGLTDSLTSGFSPTQLNLTRGNIKGKLLISVTENDALVYSGKIKIDGLALNSPKLGIEAELPELSFHVDHFTLEPNVEAKSKFLEIVAADANVRFTDASQRANQLVALSELQGRLNFRNNTANFDVQSQYQNGTENLQFILNGVGETQGNHLRTINVNAFLNQDAEEITKLQFNCDNAVDRHGKQSGILELKNFRKTESQLVVNCLSYYYPSLKFLDIKEGILDLSLKSELFDHKPQEVIVESIDMRHLSLTLPEWQLFLQLPRVQGNVRINLAAENVFDMLDADIALDGATFQCGALEAPAENVDAKVNIKKGTLLTSTFQGDFAGLRGTVSFDHSHPQELAKASFQGGTKEVAVLLPDVLRHGIEKRFINDTLNIDIAVAKNSRGLSVQSTLDIFDAFENQHYPVAISFDLIKSSEKFWKRWPPAQNIVQYWENHAEHVFQHFLPQLLNLSILMGCEQVQHASGWKGLLISNGNFHAQNISLDKFIEPFLFDKDQFQLSGRGDFSGTFDLNGAVIDYQCSAATLENDDINMEVKAGQAEEQQLCGRHYFDFNRNRDSGEVQMSNAVYYDKTNGLFFTHINAKAFVGASRISMENIETCCHQMNFSGAINIDYSCPDPGYFDVDVFVNKMSGKVSNLQAIFSHFDDLRMLSSWPLEGDVSLCPKGGMMRFAFDPEDFKLQVQGRGIIHNGIITPDTNLAAVEQLSLSMDYDHQAGTIHIGDLKGILKLGKPDNSTSYLIDGSRCCVHELCSRKADFDLKVVSSDSAFPVDERQPLIRIAGFCHRASKGDWIQITFDKNLTQFIGSHPLAIELELSKNLDVNAFHLNLPIDLAKLRRQAAPLLESCWKGIDQAEVEFPKLGGICTTDIQYHRNTAQLNYSLVTNNFTLGKNNYSKALLQGKKKGSRWSIEQLQLDDLSIAADICKNDDKLSCDFVGVRWGDTLLAGLTGEYEFSKRAFVGEANLLEIDLAKMQSLPGCGEWTENYTPQGNFKGQGSFRCELIDFAPGWRIEANLNAAIQNLKLKDLQFESIQNLNCVWDSNEYIKFISLAPTGFSNPNGTRLGSIQFDTYNWNYINDVLAVEGIHLDAPAAQLKLLSTELQRCYPEEISDFSAKLLSRCKNENSFHADIAFVKAPSNFSFTMRPADGKYWIAGAEHEISNCCLEITQKHKNFLFHYKFRQSPFWVSLQSENPTHGNIYCAANLSSIQKRDNNQDLLTITWRENSKEGFVIDTMNGSFCGLGVALQRQEEPSSSADVISLSGDLALDVPIAAKLMSPEVREGLAALQVGRGYSMRGNWKINKNGSDGSGSFYKFQGMLIGNNIEFKGYNFQRFQADVSLSAIGINARNLWLQDPSGNLHIEHFSTFDNPQNQFWTAEFKKIILTNFRPSLLHRVGMPVPTMAKHFVMPKLEIPVLHGQLGNSQSFIGNGFFDFSNHSKRVINHPLFVIPTEILNRIGLDMSVLNPVMGIVYFNVLNGYVFLTKFKDVYSEGKLSKFYLQSGDRSYLDFDGNLSLHVRMKQYNLLFKLAELFTVKVGGTVFKPVYSLEKQQHKQRMKKF